MGDPEGDRPWITTPIEATPSPPTAAPRPTHASYDDLSEDLGEVLSAEGEFPRSSKTSDIMEKPAMHRAVQVFTNPATLARQQQDDTRLGQVRSGLRESSGTCAGGVDTKGYVLDKDDAIRYTDERGKGLPAISESMDVYVFGLVHTLPGHAGVGITLPSVQDRLHWTSITRDTRQCVLSCGCRWRKIPNI